MLWVASPFAWAQPIRPLAGRRIELQAPNAFPADFTYTAPRPSRRFWTPCSNSIFSLSSMLRTAGLEPKLMLKMSMLADGGFASLAPVAST